MALISAQPQRLIHAVAHSQVQGAEGVSKRKLFEIMDGLEAESRPLMEVTTLGFSLIVRVHHDKSSSACLRCCQAPIDDAASRTL